MSNSAGMVTSGIQSLQHSFQRFIDAAHGLEEEEWWVGTVVEYAIYHEFGTRRMRARPWFRPAIRKVRLRFGAGAAIDSRKLWQDILAGRPGLVRTIALELEREAKQEIRRKGLIDTGNMRASVTAAPTKQDAASESERRVRENEED